MSIKPVDTVGCNSLSDIILEDQHFMNDLVSDSDVQNLAGFFSIFQKTITSFYGYEIQLGSESPADLLFCTHLPKELVTALNAVPAFSQSKDVFVSKLTAFGSRWQKELKAKISNVWFEYDFEQIIAGNYIPNFFVGPARGLHPLEVLVELQKLFSTDSGIENRDTYRSLLTCYRVLPKGAWISQIGQMKARGEDGFRVFVQDIPKGEIPSFLERLEYTGDISERLLFWLDKAGVYGSKVDLDLDFEEGTSRKIGLEVYCKDRGRAKAFLQELLSEGLCTEILCNKLSSYLDRAIYQSENSRHCFLSHFKIVYDGESRFAAKAYIGFVSDDQKSFVEGTKP